VFETDAPKVCRVLRKIVFYRYPVCFDDYQNVFYRYPVCFDDYQNVFYRNPVCFDD